jgi:hypothetical protein
MFSKAGIIELHAATHERLDLLLRHVATVPDKLRHKPISGVRRNFDKLERRRLDAVDGWLGDR